MKIAIAGCGALGSHIAMFIGQPEMQMKLVDYDRIEPHNVYTGTSAYLSNHIGKFKTHVLAQLLYQKYKIEADVYNKRIETAKAFNDCDLIVDCFDNVMARRCTMEGKNMVHVGVSPQMIGAVEWQDTYRLPEHNEEENQICTHEVGRDIILATSVVAANIIRDFLATGYLRTAVINDQVELL
jgi:hypothetical protein